MYRSISLNKRPINDLLQGKKKEIKKTYFYVDALINLFNVMLN